VPGEPRRWSRWPARAWSAAAVVLSLITVVAFARGWTLNQPVLMIPPLALAAGTNFWRLFGGISPPATAFVVDERGGEFAAPVRLAHSVSLAAWSLACLTMLLVVPFAFLRPLFLAPAIFQGLLAVWFLPGCGARRLAPLGLLPGRGLRRAATPIPWDEIVGAVAEAPAADIFGRRSALGVTMVWLGRADPLHLQWVDLDVDVRLMADAIEYYRAHPEHRAAIGTVAEHRRLYTALIHQYTA